MDIVKIKLILVTIGTFLKQQSKSLKRLIAREQALHLGDIVNGRRARGTRVPASPLARAFSLHSPK